MKKNIKNFLLIVIVIVFLLFISTRSPYIGHEDYEISNTSCMSFGFFTYGEYDCDSEMSRMPFGDYYGNYYFYSYNRITKTLTFSGLSVKPLKAKVLKWTKDELEFELLNCDIENGCDSGESNRYRYFKRSIVRTGNEIKDLINNNGNNKIEINYKSYDGYLYYNILDEEFDYNAKSKQVSTKYIIDKIDDKKKYELIITTEGKGTITYIYISSKDN